MFNCDIMQDVADKFGVGFQGIFIEFDCVLVLS